jgi:cytoskeleton protein RodZ
MLRQARETSGVTLDAVAARTRISRRYLEALERSDLSVLPGGVFGKAYIRTIADLIEVDPAPILEAYETEERRVRRGSPESEDRTLMELSATAPPTGGRPRPLRSVTHRAWLWVLASAALGSIAAIGFLQATRKPPEPTPGRSDFHRAPPAAPEPSPTPTPSSHPSPSAASGSGGPSGLIVSGFGVGTGLVDRVLTGRADRFAEGTRVLFWTRVIGGESGQTLRHVWLHQGHTVMRTKLEIGGPHWRTFSALELPKDATGPWTVEARGPNGNLLAREEFLCLPSPGSSQRGNAGGVALALGHFRR